MANPRGQQRDKPFREALRMEIAEKGDNFRALRGIAAKLIASAEAGDLQAIREIADRLDGRPAQAIEHSGEVTNRVVRAPAVIPEAQEWAEKHVPTAQ